MGFGNSAARSEAVQILRELAQGDAQLRFGFEDRGAWLVEGILADEIIHDPLPPPGNGVMMAEGNLVASYNALNQPVAMIPTGSANIYWFGFDPLGRCVKRWIGGSGDANSNPATYLYYDGWNLIQEGASAASPSMVYYHGARVDEMVASYNTATDMMAYHYYDANGNCTLLTDWQGNIMEQYYYDAFGYPYFYNGSGAWLGSSPHGNRFLFTGREWLSELKLYDYRHRMYNPELGRFMQPDPQQFAAGDYNLYRYSHNDPVNRTDPTGLQDDKCPLTVCGEGDWITGSDGLSAWDRTVGGMPSNRWQAGENGAGGGDDGSKDTMKFVPTKLQKDKDGKPTKYAQPSASDHSGGYYEYQFKDSADNRKSGVGYRVQEKLSLVPGVPNNWKVTKKDEKPRELQTNGIYRDYVGLWFRPTSEFNGLTSVVYQTFDVKYNGRPVEVSTRLVHDVRVINGEVVHKVWIDRP